MASTLADFFHPLMLSARIKADPLCIPNSSFKILQNTPLYISHAPLFLIAISSKPFGGLDGVELSGVVGVMYAEELEGGWVSGGGGMAIEGGRSCGCSGLGEDNAFDQSSKPDGGNSNNDDNNNDNAAPPPPLMPDAAIRNHQI
eukprot:CAMPEP_0183328660 /NCGR_PEP_ID=MMETSP0160_2-20130417/84397_1 /TAXON_ID=2839 ORGANISM="Odontella Sinensis, Strain Grunow 1884" /NCGR_SAMPLE_ID=MMETSP0160_2 /ASSEMBLY_ACC=CAM_ASM_000250 /LENGTH=143 /DNA_ID=CAMNT_0025496827 /DNA_START=285 /DNA_END=717 /DNA_ORIENTATION=+